MGAESVDTREDKANAIMVGHGLTLFFIHGRFVVRNGSVYAQSRHRGWRLRAGHVVSIDLGMRIEPRLGMCTILIVSPRGGKG